jgi:putative anti-sigma factor
VRYAAVVAVAVASGLFFITDWFCADSPDGIDMMAYNEPTLLLEGGDEIDLSGQSFTMKRDQALIKNDADNLLSYEAEDGTDKAKIVHNRLIIPRGKTYRLVLEDGTKVWLNSETELSYPSRFAGTKREVMLLGEAFFEVTPDKERPFYVKANGMDIRVLGTSFNVSAYQDSESTSTTLVEGSVAVSTANGAERTITPSERLAYNKKSHQLSVEKVDTELYTSWINGVYIFKNMPLEEILEKLSRWYDFSVTYQDETLKHTRFSLTADRKTDIDKLLEVINYTSDVKLEKQGKSINVKKQRRIQ